MASAYGVHALGAKMTNLVVVAVAVVKSKAPYCINVLIRLATKYKLLQFYDLSTQEYRQETLKIYQIAQNKLHNYKI